MAILVMTQDVTSGRGTNGHVTSGSGNTGNDTSGEWNGIL